MLKRWKLTSINEILKAELNLVCNFQLKSEWENFMNRFGGPRERDPKDTENATNREGFCSYLWWKHSEWKVSERDRVENEREEEEKEKQKRVNKRSLSQWVLFFLNIKNNNLIIKIYSICNYHMEPFHIIARAYFFNLIFWFSNEHFPEIRVEFKIWSNTCFR